MPIGYYASVIDPDKPSRRGLLLGPYDTHEQALAKVDTAARLAADADPRAPWYAFGTCQIDAPGWLFLPIGKLNERDTTP